MSASTYCLSDAEKRKLESGVRVVISGYFAALHSCDGETFDAVWHPDGKLLGATPEGAVCERGAAEFRAGVVKRGESTSEEYTKHDRLLSLNVIDAHTAAAKVQVALPPAPDSPTPSLVPTLYTDVLVLLWEEVHGWRIISKVFAAAPLGELAVPRPIEPIHFAEVAQAVWGLYVGGGRECDVDKMRSVFHPVSNLTFSTGGGPVAIIPSAAFCERVGTRWSVPEHAKHAHLKDDPRAAACDSLISIDFAGPDVAFVVLKIGYPPFLYTDLLSLIKLEGSKWWIVAKSSCNEPYLAEEAKE